MQSKHKLQSASPPTDSRTTRARINLSQRWLVATIALGVSALVLFNNSAWIGSYTICSKSKNIYTVDPSNPRIECITVRGREISQVGNYGEFLRLSNRRIALRRIVGSSRSDPKIIAESIARSQIYLTEAVGLLPSRITRHMRIGGRIIQLDESSVLVPGLAGASSRYCDHSLPYIPFL